MIHYAIHDYGTGANLPLLVDLLQGPGISIDISFDSDESSLERVRQALADHPPPLTLRHSPSISWGGNGLHTAMLQSMQHALQQPDWNYFINLSGSCLPLRTPTELLRQLEENAERGRLGFCNSYRLGKPLAWVSSQIEPAARKDCINHNVHGRASFLVDPCLKDMVEQNRLDPPRNIGQRVGLMYTEIEKNTYWVRPLSPDELRERARFLAEQPLRYGRHWLVLHRSIVAWLLQSTILERSMHFMAGCFISEEMIFAMALFSQDNPYLAAMDTDNLRHLQGGPQRIPLDELPTLLNSGDRLTARKISAGDYPAAADLVRRLLAA